MKEPKVLVTMKDIQRYRIIKDVLEDKLKAVQAVQILELSYIHLLRLKKKVKESGFKGLLRADREAPNNLPEDLKETVTSLYKEYYYDFNILHFKDKLDEIYNIHLSYETIRQTLIQAGKHHPKKKKIIHRQHRGMPKAELMEQISSQHQ